MNNYQYGKCIPEKSSVMSVTHTYVGKNTIAKAQIGSTFIGNIMFESEMEYGTKLEQYWLDKDKNVLFAVRYPGSGVSVKCYSGANLVGRIPVADGASFGIARVGNRVVMTLEGLDAFLIDDNANTGEVDVFFETGDGLTSVRAGYSESDDFNNLRANLEYTTTLNPLDDWDNTIFMDCPENKEQPLALRKCPVTICNKKGSCLAYVKYDVAINISGLACELNGVRLCSYSIGIIDDVLLGGKRLLLIDGSRGFITTPLDISALNLLFEEYNTYDGIVFKLINSVKDLKAIESKRKVGVYPDMIILDETHADKPVLRFYRSLSGNLAELLTVDLLRPTSLGSGRIQNCRVHIINTYRDRDTVDTCTSIIVNACTSGCSGWIHHPSILSGDWKASFRVQGDLNFNFNKPDSLVAWLSISIDISNHRLTIKSDIGTTVVNTPILVGNKISICVVGNMLTVYVDEYANYRIITNIPPSLNIWSNPGNTISNGLVDPRLNGVMLEHWEGDETFEEVSGCGVVKGPTEKVVVKDLYPDCDTGVLYYRELTTTINKGSPVRVFKPQAEVYRSFVDIYLEGRSGIDTIINIYIANTSTPFTKNLIAANVKIKKGDTYTRRMQPLAMGESLFIMSSRNNLDVFLQTVEETWARV